MKAAICVLFLSVMTALGCADPPAEPIPQAIADEDMIEGSYKNLASVKQEVKSHGNASYDRHRAVWYAKKYANKPNPNFAYCMNRRTFTSADCTNFVSQALWFGGLRYDASGNDTEGWWYNGGCRKGKSSRSWRLVNDLIYYLVVESRRGKFVSIDDVQLGDLVFYKLPDPDTLVCDDTFTLHHSTIVTGFTDSGKPLVSYHSNEVADIPWNWSLNESGIIGLGDACGYMAVHILD